MDQPNENIEGFFRKSLDKFSDAPSENVWEELDVRLEQDMPKRGIWFWLQSLIPVAIILAGFAFYNKQSNLLKDYQTQLTLLADENQTLKQHLETQKSLNASSTEIESPESSVVLEQKQFQTITKIIRDTVYLYNSKYEGQTRLTSPDLFLKEWNTTQGASQVWSINYKNLGNSEISDSYAERINLSNINLLPSRDYASNSISSLSSFQLPPIQFNAPTASRKEIKRKKKKIPNGPLIVMKSDPWGKPNLYYRAGITANVLNTLKGDVFSISSIGLGYGFTQELGLTTRFAITSGFTRGFQEYNLSNSGETLQNDQINSYPNISDFENDIVSLEVENKYWEFPLGIKYDFYQDNIKSFFVNPVVKWSIHEPQSFTYFLTENRLNPFDSSQRFGYLNAVGLSLGVEKSINRSISYQMSLGYDYAIEPTGLERQKLNTVNFRFNLLFGKK